MPTMMLWIAVALGAEVVTLEAHEGRPAVEVAVIGPDQSGSVAPLAVLTTKPISRIGEDHVLALLLRSRWLGRRHNYQRRTTVPEVRVGELARTNVDTVVTTGDGMVLSTTLFDGVAVLPSRGEVWFGTADEVREVVGPPADLANASVAGRRGPVRLDLARAVSAIAVDLPGPPHVERGIRWWKASVSVGDVTREVWLRREENLKADEAIAVLGLDWIGGLDLGLMGDEVSLADNGGTWDAEVPPADPVPCSEVGQLDWCAAWVDAVEHLQLGEWAAAEGRLRQAIHLGARADTEVRLALAWAEAKQGRTGILPLAEHFVVPEERLPRAAALALHIAAEVGLRDEVFAALKATHPRADWSEELPEPMLPAWMVDVDTAFLRRHWSPPMQAAPPDTWPSLKPEACGSCHAQQLADWEGTRHAQAMSPLVQALMADDPQHADTCVACHAPLEEQREEPDLAAHGLLCAACHVRDGTVYGPPRRDGVEAAASPHDGFVARDAYEDSRFCASCHQFEEGDRAIDGVLLENTFVEWAASPQGQAGQSCQSCHMPDRRHTWRGIHDADFTEAGLSFDLAQADGAYVYTVTNSGVGHHFPTYATPRAILVIRALDASGAELETRRTFVAREVAPDLSSQRFDTRLAAGASASVTLVPPPGTATVEASLRIEPDAFYEQDRPRSSYVIGKRVSPAE